MMSGTSSVSAFPDGDNLFNWKGTITGAAGTVYESLTYKLTLSFPADYPYSAPHVKFETACYHPNVDQYGNICLDILKVCPISDLSLPCIGLWPGSIGQLVRTPAGSLSLPSYPFFFIFAPHTANVPHVITNTRQRLQEQWSALYDVRTVLLSIQSMMGGGFVQLFWPVLAVISLKPRQLN